MTIEKEPNCSESLSKNYKRINEGLEKAHDLMKYLFLWKGLFHITFFRSFRDKFEILKYNLEEVNSKAKEDNDLIKSQNRSLQSKLTCILDSPENQFHNE